MSAPTVDPDPSSAHLRRESLGGAVGTLLGLAVLGGALWFALRPAAGFFDPAPELARAFELGELPFGLEPEAAARLGGGEWVVSYAAPSARGEAPADPLQWQQEPDPGEEAPRAVGAARRPEVDWAGLGARAGGTAPTRIFLVRWPPARAEAERRRLFEGLRFRDVKDLGPRGGRALLAREALPWHGLAARAVHERSYHRADSTPTFVESVRVDLALPGEPWMLVALWPPRETAALEPVRELLRALAPRSR